MINSNVRSNFFLFFFPFFNTVFDTKEYVNVFIVLLLSLSWNIIAFTFRVLLYIHLYLNSVLYGFVSKLHKIGIMGW